MRARAERQEEQREQPSSRSTVEPSPPIGQQMKTPLNESGNTPHSAVPHDPKNNFSDSALKSAAERAKEKAVPVEEIQNMPTPNIWARLRGWVVCCSGVGSVWRSARRKVGVIGAIRGRGRV